MSILQQIIDNLASQSLEAFDLAKAVHHGGESGRAREEVIRGFLDHITPPDFGVGTGFVVDAVGGTSKQIDIVIYRKSRCPVLDVGGVNHFMVESVAAVIEVKAAIDSEADLIMALENIASVKRLDRTGDGRNIVVSPTVRKLDPSDVRDQVFGGVVAGSSMTYESCLTKIGDYFEANSDRRCWPNTYVDVKEFMIDFFTNTGPAGRERTSDPMHADGIQGGRASKRPPLADFATSLLDFLQVIPEITYRTSSRPNSSLTGSVGYFYRTMVPLPASLHFDDFGKP